LAAESVLQLFQSKSKPQQAPIFYILVALIAPPLLFSAKQKYEEERIFFFAVAFIVYAAVKIMFLTAFY